MLCCFFFFTDPATTEIYTLSLHDALPISIGIIPAQMRLDPRDQLAWTERLSDVVVSADLETQYAVHFVGARGEKQNRRSEEHTSELQSLAYLVCRLLLEKKKKNKQYQHQQ